MELAKERGAKRVIPLAVSGAFHSPVMQPAASGLAQTIAAMPIHETSIPVIGNIQAAPLSDAEAIHAELAQQLLRPFNGHAPSNIWSTRASRSLSRLAPARH